MTGSLGRGMELAGGPHTRRTSPQRLVALLLVLTMVVVSCSDGGDNEAADGEDTGADSSAEVDGSAGEGAISVDASLELVDPTGEALFPCSEVAGAPTIAYVDTGRSEPGRNADRMRAVVGDHNRRCGTAVELVPFVADAADPAGCEPVLAADPVLTVVSHPRAPVVGCFVEAGAPVWVEGAIPTSLAAEGTVLGTEAPSDTTAVLQVRLLAGEGLVDGRAVSVVHDGTAEAEPVASAGFAPALEEAGATVTTIDVGPGCDAGRAVDAWADAVVVTVVPAPCLLTLADAALAAGATPQWIVADHERAISDDNGVALDGVERTMDVALAYSASPAIGAGWPRVLDPHARDAACTTYLDDLLGTETLHPSSSWHDGARLCSTAYALFRLLAAAGPDPDAGALIAALAEVDDVPFPHGQTGGFAADKAWVGPAQLFALEWSADCGCWTHVGGPLAAAG